MANSDESSAYSSADDLPSVRELRQLLAGGKLITRVIGRSQRQNLLDVERQLSELVETVDKFYDVLGPSHWVFHDDLNAPEMVQLLSATSDREVVQAQFIERQYSRERLSFMIGRLRALPDMNARFELIKKAEEDYWAGRYYSTVLLLITVMDGFVNDMDKSQRAGLHTKSEEDINPWDTVVGHHQGLKATQRSFTKGFKTRNDDVITELYRNGIVHGMLTNYDNIVVAAKAWNRLLAVADWAKSLAKQAAPTPNPPKLKDAFRQMAETAQLQQALNQWTPSTLRADDAAFEQQEVKAQVEEFFENWQAGRWGLIAKVFPERELARAGKNVGKHIRDIFDQPRLLEFRITSIDYPAPVIAVCHHRTSFGSFGRFDSSSRWIYEGPNQKTVLPSSGLGTWRLVAAGSWPFLRSTDVDEEK